MKKVTVYRTVGSNMASFNSEANTWADLQKNLKEAKIDFSGMKAVVGESRVTLEAPDAVLPEGDFTLFLMPVKVKSGSERSDLFDKIKAFIGNDASKKQLFIIDGKNMTQIATDKLKELAAKYIGGTAPTTPAAPQKVAKVPKTEANVADVVAAVADFKELEEAIAKAKEKYQKAVAADVDEETQDILLEKLTAAKAALKTAQSAPPPPAPIKKAEPVESHAEKLAREQREFEASEKLRLLGQARDIAKGLTGLQSF